MSPSKLVTLSRTFGFALALVAVVSAPLSAHAGTIVFGNLGATGTSNLSTTNTDLGQQKPADTNWLAQGFNTGTSSLLSVDAITVGLFGGDPTPVPLTVAIYSSVLNKPDTLLYTSGTVSVGTSGKYSFPFTGATLTASTEYFVVPNGGSWYWASGSALAATPAEQNASGYSYTRTVESLAQTTTPSGPWVDPAASNRYSVSVEAVAVPEPSTLLLAGVGVSAAIGYNTLRKRRS